LRHEKLLVGIPPVPEIMNQIDPLPLKTAIFNLYALVAPQP